MSHHRRPFREHFVAPRPERYFRWRGREVSRVEGFADAVFAFAVTLLIVALEVPHTFEGLMEAMRSFPAFVVCFAFLMLFWNCHYRFFRRYGLEDRLTRFLTMAILLLVLFSVYPLKFLFGAILSFGAEHAPHIETSAQLNLVYRIYGLGFACIWSLYALLEVHGMKLRDALRLTPVELLVSRESLVGYLINVGVCLLSVGMSFFNVSNSAPGFTYMLLGPLLTWNGAWHGAQIRRRAEERWEHRPGPA
jgi:uncharacterized membrane protein